MLSIKEREEIKRFIKNLRKEGSTTDGVGGYGTPKAFVGDSEAEGSAKATGADKAFIIKPDKKKRHFIKLQEVSYQVFKSDNSMTESQKINRKILAVNKMLREVSQALDHSLKLKKEASMDDSALWKKTGQSILKMHKRMREVRSKVGSLANLKELAIGSLKDRLVKLFNKAGIPIQASDISYHQIGNEQYELDISVNGEPIPLDYNNGSLVYQGPDSEVYLGDLNQNDQALIQNIIKTLK